MGGRAAAVVAVLAALVVAGCGDGSPREQAEHEATDRVRAYADEVREGVDWMAGNAADPGELKDQVVASHNGDELTGTSQAVVTDSRVDGGRAVFVIAAWSPGTAGPIGSGNVWAQTCLQITATPGRGGDTTMTGTDCPGSVRGKHPRTDLVVALSD
jgi:hypothetical protein